LVQEHLEGLLEQQSLLDAEGKVEMVNTCDENTKFFHANGTIKHSKNSIMTLENRDGGLIT
jgi:hypothetical protein